MTMKMIVCPTTHDDWDWLATFAGYYQTGYQTNASVHDILQQVIAAFNTSTQFCFSYAEAGFLRAYLHDPSVLREPALATLRGAGRRFSLLGGGITSPDNIRIYLRFVCEKPRISGNSTRRSASIRLRMPAKIAADRDRLTRQGLAVRGQAPRARSVCRDAAICH